MRFMTFSPSSKPRADRGLARLQSIRGASHPAAPPYRSTGVENRIGKLNGG